MPYFRNLELLIIKNNDKTKLERYRIEPKKQG